MSFLPCKFVTATILIEFGKGARVIAAKEGRSLFAGLLKLTHRNTRRYGGYVVHLGIVMMFVGFTGAAFNQESVAELGPEETLRIGVYTLQLKNVTQGDNRNYGWAKTWLAVRNRGRDSGALEPERRMYFADNQQSTEVAVRRRLNEDSTSALPDHPTTAGAGIYASCFPPASWIGYFTILAGTMICLMPNKSLRAATQKEAIDAPADPLPVEC